MALGRCRECKSRISTEALACPKCGVSEPTRKMPMKTGHKIAHSITITCFALLVVLVVTHANSDTPEGASVASTVESKPDRPDFERPLFLHANSQICADLDEIKALVDHEPTNCTTAPGTVRIYETKMELLGLMGSDGVAIAFRAETKDGGAVEAYALMSDIDNNPD